MRIKASITLPMVAAVLAISACKKGDNTPGYADTTPALNVPSSTTVDIGDIDMGKHIDADKKISDKTDDFAAKDTIFASIHTKGGTVPTVLTARWTFQDGQVVNEETATVAAGADANTEFHIVKPGGWAKGKYTIHVLADGKEVKTKDVEVK